MTVLSQVDPTADIACTLPVNEAGDRLRALQNLIGGRPHSVVKVDNRLRVRIERSASSGFDAEVAEWAAAEKQCCAFLGFAVEPETDAVTLEIAAPAGAEPTLEGIEWIVRALGQQGAPHPGRHRCRVRLIDQLLVRSRLPASVRRAERREVRRRPGLIRALIGLP